MLEQATGLLAACERRGVGVVIGGPFNSGVLARADGTFNYAAAPPDVLSRVERLRTVCDRFDAALPAAALQFAAAHPAVVSVIPDVRRTPQEVAANAAMMDAVVIPPALLTASEGRGDLIDPTAPTPAAGDRRVLKGIDPLLGPELLATLRAMGHADEIAVVDANFPAAANARRLVRAGGAEARRG